MNDLWEAYQEWLKTPAGQDALMEASRHGSNDFHLRVAFMSGAEMQMRIAKAHIMERLHTVLFKIE
jgi:hypothetical protein